MLRQSRIVRIISDTHSFVHTIITHFLDFLFPLSCAGWGRAGTLLCGVCMERVSLAQGAPGGVVSFFDYRDPVVRRGIWELKYRGKYGWADIFGALAYEKLLEELSDAALFDDFRNLIIVPVPLAPKRLRERGYNQSALLARAVAEEDAGANTFTIDEKMLVRVRETESQMEIKNRAKRLANMVGAFSADPAIVQGKNIIVLDDVSTTGATLYACREALISAGARQVMLISIAH